MILRHVLTRFYSVIVYCRTYVHKFLGLAERPDFQPWHWCWVSIHFLNGLVAI